MSRRTRIEHREFICKGNEHHRFRARVKLQTSDSGESIEHTAEFLVQRVSSDQIGSKVSAFWEALPICDCGAIAEESSTYDPTLAGVPASERMQVWLSPDGQRVAIPGKRDAPMPSRYLAAGYRALEAHSMRDIDRIEQIRAAQTGNEVVSELNFDAERRTWHAEREHDPDDMNRM